MWSTVFLVAEDLPGLAVGRRLVGEHPSLTVYRAENAHGCGKLRRNAPKYNQMGSRGFPVLMLTDLDADVCPSAKVADWLEGPPSRGFLFRICVREIEAWLLADREGISSFLKVPRASVPQTPESLPDPKNTLIRLAGGSPRRIREGLTPSGRATIGHQYNELLTGFIVDQWCIDAAANRAPSLARARRRVAELATLVSTPGPAEVE
jgi:hypothetical protein